MKRLYIVISVVMVMGMVLGACATPTAQTVIQTVQVPVVQTQVVKETQIQTVIQTQIVAPTAVPAEEQLPRNETLYFNGLAVVCGGWLESLLFQHEQCHGRDRTRRSPCSDVRNLVPV